MAESCEIQPPVVPRGHLAGATAALRVDDLLRQAIRQQETGLIYLCGGAGGGKSTSLDYLRKTLASESKIGFFESYEIAGAMDAAAAKVAVVTTSALAQNLIGIRLELSPWTIDDCVEYLAARHRDQIGSVMNRLKADHSVQRLEGCPQLLSFVMDAMAGDESLKTCRQIIRTHLQQLFPSVDDNIQLLNSTGSTTLTGEQARWWRHRTIQKIFKADWIAQQLSQRSMPSMMHSVALTGDFIEDIAAFASPDAITFLDHFVEDHPRHLAVPMSASILLVVDRDWRPKRGRNINLQNAELRGARWAGVHLKGAILTGAKMLRADLSGANLKRAKLDHANLSHASLNGARLSYAYLEQTNLSFANLVRAKADKAGLHTVDLNHADLTNADFSQALISSVNFTNARCVATNFSNANFVASTGVDDADFSNADFSQARFRGMHFSNAILHGAKFHAAQLMQCNFEGMEIQRISFSNAQLTGSLFTSSVMSFANFEGADLSKTGLAEVEWEDADLSDADLTDASFHLGSTRSGLVGSTIAGEGSRTGFYTDEFNEQLYKSPDEIRKANLRGCDLSGAKIEKTDFYLVDLRDATYTMRQSEHLKKTGAIL